MPNAIITNALVRCTRSDLRAAAMFELVSKDIGLWVLDLDINQDGTLSEQIARIYEQLQSIYTELSNLRDRSIDYTLHLTFDLPRTVPIILPTNLSTLAAECGINLEIYVNTIEEG
jgi:hypothetical protein